MASGMKYVRAGAVPVLAAVLVCAGRWTASRAPATPMVPAAPRQAAVQPPVAPSPSWRLLYVSDGGVWVARGDGSGQRLLIPHAQAPCWSPDHRAIAFVRAGQVWTSDAEGEHQRQLTAMPYDEVPVEDGWSSDGRPVDLTWDPVDDAIFFSRSEQFHVTATRDAVRPLRSDRPREDDVAAASIFRVRVSAERDATPEVCWSLLDYSTPAFPDYSHPALSRDGWRLALCCNGDIWCAVRSAPPAGIFARPKREQRTGACWEWWSSRLAAVADYQAANRGDEEVHLATHLAWSPDGTQLAYDKRRVGGSGFKEVHVLDVRRENELCLAAGGDRTLAQDGTHPCFSPNGRFIAYHGTATGDWREPWGIVVMPVDGTSRRLIIPDGDEPAW